MRVEVVDRVEQFEALRPEWSALLRSSAADCPFLTWEWAHAWWTHLRGSASLRLLVVRRGDSVMALAPLRLCPGTLPWFSRLEFIGSGTAGSDYLDLIVRTGAERESLQALATFIHRERVALHLDHLPPDAMATGLATEMHGCGWTSRSSFAGSCPLIQLAGHSWESYLATLGASHRANVRRRLKALGRDFTVRFENSASEPLRLEVLAALNGFHARRWSGRGSTTFQTPALCAFHDDVTRRALECGWLRLYVLYLNERIAAALYGFMYNQRFYFFQHGFDAAFERHSVGLVLMGLAIREAIGEGAAEFDMLYGTESYKWLWAAQQRALGRLEMFPADLGGRIYQRRIEAESTLRSFAKRLLAREVPRQGAGQAPRLRSGQADAA